MKCPHIFCGRCADKMKIEHGTDAFVDGCPVCHELCCCVNKTVYCNRKNHCYRKCPASKSVDSIAKANTPLWDYRSDTYTGRPHYSNGNRNDTSYINESIFASGSFAKSCSGDRSNKNNMVTSDNIIYSDGLVPSLSVPLPSFHQMQPHAVSVSKHGSLDFLAAAVSIIDHNDHINNNIEIIYEDTKNKCNNVNQYYINDNQDKFKENPSSFSRSHIHTDVIRKRTRESGNVRSSSVSVTKDDGDNSDGRIFFPLSNEKSKNYDDLNEIDNNDINSSNNNNESNNEINNKATRKVSDQFEFSTRLPTPPPLYFLASNLLPSRNLNVRSGRNITCMSDELIEQKEMTWNGSKVQISDTTSIQRELCSLSKLQNDKNRSEVGDIGIVEERDDEVEIEVASNLSCQEFDRTHGKTVQFRAVSNSFKQHELHQEIPFETNYNSLRSSDSSSSLYSSQTCVPINQLVRNVSNEEYVTRNLISGPNHANHNNRNYNNNNHNNTNNNNDNYYYYQQIKEIMPQDGVHMTNKSNSNNSTYQQSSRYYHSIVPLSSQLHPPPL